MDLYRCEKKKGHPSIDEQPSISRIYFLGTTVNLAEC